MEADDQINAKNPLRYKKQETQLHDMAKKIRMERLDWIDAQMKKYLPHDIYKLAHQKDVRCLGRVAQWMKENEVQIIHDELETRIYKGREVLARFVVQLVEQ